MLRLTGKMHNVLLDKNHFIKNSFIIKPTYSGTRFGLSLSNDIVKAHGGTITVESTERKGIEFIIKLNIGS